MWETLGPWVVSGGLGTVVTIVLGYAYKLHKDAVDAHAKRADDWKTAFDREVNRGDEKDQQLKLILRALELDRERT